MFQRLRQFKSTTDNINTPPQLNKKSLEAETKSTEGESPYPVIKTQEVNGTSINLHQNSKGRKQSANKQVLETMDQQIPKKFRKEFLQRSTSSTSKRSNQEEEQTEPEDSIEYHSPLSPSQSYPDGWTQSKDEVERQAVSSAFLTSNTSKKSYFRGTTHTDGFLSRVSTRMTSYNTWSAISNPERRTRINKKLSSIPSSLRSFRRSNSAQTKTTDNRVSNESSVIFVQNGVQVCTPFGIGTVVGTPAVSTDENDSLMSDSCVRVESMSRFDERVTGYFQPIDSDLFPIRLSLNQQISTKFGNGIVQNFDETTRAYCIELIDGIGSKMENEKITPVKFYWNGIENIHEDKSKIQTFSHAIHKSFKGAMINPLVKGKQQVHRSVNRITQAIFSTHASGIALEEQVLTPFGIGTVLSKKLVNKSVVYEVSLLDSNHPEENEAISHTVAYIQASDISRAIDEESLHYFSKFHRVGTRVRNHWISKKQNKNMDKSTELEIKNIREVINKLSLDSNHQEKILNIMETHEQNIVELYHQCLISEETIEQKEQEKIKKKSNIKGLRVNSVPKFMSSLGNNWIKRKFSNPEESNREQIMKLNMDMFEEMIKKYVEDEEI